MEKKKVVDAFLFFQRNFRFISKWHFSRKGNKCKMWLTWVISIKNHCRRLYTNFAFTLSIGTASVFPIHTRCIMMLIMAEIATGRGRGFLLTMVVNKSPNWRTGQWYQL